MADSIRAEIVSGRFRPGDKLPSIRSLAAAHGVAEVTARNALRLMTDEGLAFPDTTRGYFVAEQARTGRLRRGPEYLPIKGQLDTIVEDMDRMNERLTKLEELVRAQLPARQPESRRRSRKDLPKT